jgi:homoserine O-acetyltransferase/O-succinyltransferase
VLLDGEGGQLLSVAGLDAARLPGLSVRLATTEPLRLDSGAQLGPVTVAYQIYGRLNADRSNAILVAHALTGDQFAGEPHPITGKEGWWEIMIGPGKPLDTDRYFILCANVLGGCMGTTGPVDRNPATGQPYGLAFPVITIGDMVRVQAMLLDHLRIERLFCVIGGSMGGMQVLEWAARFPESIDAAIVLASGAYLSAQGIAFNTVGRRAISADPQFQAGRYDNDEGPRYGLALARMVAHITYLSQASIEMKFGRRLQDGDAFAYDLLRETEFQIESYLHYQGKRFVERFDANSYLYLTRAMDYFNLADSYGSLQAALGRTDARFLVTSYTTDWLFPTSQSKEIVRALIETGRHVTFVELDSPYGHDSFLIDMESLEALVRPFLRCTYEAVRKTALPRDT